MDVDFHFVQTSVPTSSVLAIPGMGLELSVLLPAGDAGGAMVVMETKNAPGFGPPLHRHREAEVFRVLEGRYLYEVDGRRFEVGEGELVSVPGGAAHAFRNVTDRPARQLVMMLPGMDAERFFRELAAVMAKGRPELGTLNAFGAGWGMEFLGGPISA